ncbi:biotin synthase BioB [Umezakia ovalisporum]|uniref:Biotin synthase n=1 Tax=Umezakia ovalisporum FSS-43 TaxID=2740520 RepID=A0ABT6K0R2_9CYAN|nr:biotin synthase BioB [Umezakia ovalisporum]MDH6055949.1 biotin synthase BioB [Umezakia ovalisporum FSS-43]MDH6072581.1 biotin synthase BioB [Umezakia ovalisporum CobakiLakeA]MDH6074091.1 biotin synthase BioB [Umezakia ovalisporum CS-1034]MDH6081371.1 biotin synthase BioB [Umezakia ovalisporum FSS-44]MDH6094892.1 biotin synthase BioB [Umezakia ovalisporum CobakiLakeB]
MGIRYDWQKAEIQAIYNTPFLELIYQAASVHRQYHDPRKIQVCKLISIKTGGCPEDCSYCAQSSRYKTEVKPQVLLEKETVLDIAEKAKASGVSRVCMGAAWREVRDNYQFETVLEMVKEVTEMGLEVCCTLGMLTTDQAKRLEAAGLYAYNHNLDTSQEYYNTIITTRTYGHRLKTIDHVRQTNVTVCSGGILGLGESLDDRVGMLQTLANLHPHPESVPINILSQVAGTPLENQPDVPIWDVVRMIATARIIMPSSDVRLSAGRARLSQVEQALCFMAGANSIFSSDDNKMLTVTTPCPDYDADREMLNLLGLEMRPPHQRPEKAATPAVVG